MDIKRTCNLSTHTFRYSLLTQLLAASAYTNNPRKFGGGGWKRYKGLRGPTFLVVWCTQNAPRRQQFEVAPAM